MNQPGTPDSLRTRIAAIVSAHNPGHLPDEGIDCNCGEGFRPESRGWLERAVEVERLWSQHVAGAVIRELGLRPEKGQRSNATGPLWGSNNRHTVTRYVTEWETE